MLASFPNDEGSWTQLSIIFILKALLAVFVLFFMVRRAPFAPHRSLTSPSPLARC